MSNYKDFDINDHKFYDSKRAKNFELAKDLFSNDSSNQERLFDNNTEFIIDYQTSISKLNKLLFDSKLPEVKAAIKNAFGQLSVHKIFQIGQRRFKHLLNLQKQILETPIDTIDTLYPQINENMLFHSFYIQVIKNLHSITDNESNISKNAQDEIKKIITAYDETIVQRNNIIVINENLIKAIVSRYLIRYITDFHLQFDDIFQEATIHFIRGIELFDPQKNISPSTYITSYVSGKTRNELKRLYMSFPRYYITIAQNVHEMRENFREKFGYEPSDDEIKKTLKISNKKWENYKAIIFKYSFMDPTSDYYLNLKSKETSQPIDSLILKEKINTVHLIFNLMNKKEVLVLKTLNGINNSYSKEPLTLEGCGHILNLTRERVRQIKNKALKNFKLLMTIKDLTLTSYDQNLIRLNLLNYLPVIKGYDGQGFQIVNLIYGLNAKKESLDDNKSVSFTEPLSKHIVAHKLHISVDKVDCILKRILVNFCKSDKQYTFNEVFSIYVHNELNFFIKVQNILNLRFEQRYNENLISIRELSKAFSIPKKILLKFEKIIISRLMLNDKHTINNLINTFKSHNKLSQNAHDNIFNSFFALTRLQQKIIFYNCIYSDGKFMPKEQILQKLKINEQTYKKEKSKVIKKLQYLLGKESLNNHFKYIKAFKKFSIKYGLKNNNPNAAYENFLELKSFIDNELSPKEAKIFKFLFGFKDKIYSIGELANKFNTSKSVIFEIEQKAIEKIKTNPKLFKFLTDYFTYVAKHSTALENFDYKSISENFLFLFSNYEQDIIVHSLGLLGNSIKNIKNMAIMFNKSRNMISIHRLKFISKLSAVTQIKNLDLFTQDSRMYELQEASLEKYNITFDILEYHLKSILKDFPQVYQDIFISCFGLFNNQPLTLKEISKKYNVTMKNIYLIECDIIDKLSKSVPWKMLFAFFKDKYKKMNRKISQDNIFEESLLILPILPNKKRNLLFYKLASFDDRAPSLQKVSDIINTKYYLLAKKIGRVSHILQVFLGDKANLQELLPKKFVIFKVKDREKEARDTIYSIEKNLLK